MPSEEEMFHYYRSKPWKKLRSYVLKRDKYRCTRCNRSRIRVKSLQVHHLSYLNWGLAAEGRAGMLTEAADTVILCDRCHRKEHGVGE